MSDAPDDADREGGGADDPDRIPAPGGPETVGPTPAISNPTPIQAVDTAAHRNLGPANDPASKTFASLLRFHPFCSFFNWLAAHRSSEDQTLPAAVEEFASQHWLLYYAFVVLDTLVMLAAVVGLLALAGVVALKAVWPLPF